MHGQLLKRFLCYSCFYLNMLKIELRVWLFSVDMNFAAYVCLKNFFYKDHVISNLRKLFLYTSLFSFVIVNIFFDSIFILLAVIITIVYYLYIDHKGSLRVYISCNKYVIIQWFSFYDFMLWQYLYTTDSMSHLHYEYTLQRLTWTLSTWRFPLTFD